MKPGQVLHLNVGETMRCVQSASGGGPFIYEVELEAGFGDSPPMHAHPDDEVVEVTQGSVRFDIAGEQRVLRAGERLVIPAGTMHTFGAASKTEGLRARGENGRAFERLVDQFAERGPQFTRLAMQVVSDPNGYRTGPLVHLVLRLVALIGRVRGIRPLPSAV
jgi:mannose-6-phosphate isomerase-like protein (cupin superfamily)